MEAIDEEEIWSTGCRCCAHIPCKRIMHPRLGFAVPWFLCAPNNGRALCSDFKCSKAYPYKYKIGIKPLVGILSILNLC